MSADIKPKDPLGVLATVLGAALAQYLLANPRLEAIEARVAALEYQGATIARSASEVSPVPISAYRRMAPATTGDVSDASLDPSP